MTRGAVCFSDVKFSMKLERDPDDACCVTVLIDNGEKCLRAMDSADYSDSLGILQP